MRYKFPASRSRLRRSRPAKAEGIEAAKKFADLDRDQSGQLELEECIEWFTAIQSNNPNLKPKDEL